MKWSLHMCESVVGFVRVLELKSNALRQAINLIFFICIEKTGETAEWIYKTDCIFIRWNVTYIFNIVRTNRMFNTQ